MKQFALLFSFLVTNYFAFSACSDGIDFVWPSKGKIIRNQLFAIYIATDESGNYSFSGTEFLLISGNDTVPLTIVRKLVGKERYAQLIVRPVHHLTSGRRYRMHIVGKNRDEIEMHPTSGSWIVGNQLDETRPVVRSKPRFLSKVKTNFTEGPVRFVDCCLGIYDKSRVLVDVRIKEKRSGEMQEFYIIPDSNVVSLGHGLCGGAFQLKDGEQYQAWFSVIDEAGNKSEELASALDFRAPTDKDFYADTAEIARCSCSNELRQADYKTFLTTVFFLLVVIGVFLSFNSGVISAKKP